MLLDLSKAHRQAEIAAFLAGHRHIDKYAGDDFTPPAEHLAPDKQPFARQGQETGAAQQTRLQEQRAAQSASPAQEYRVFPGRTVVSTPTTHVGWPTAPIAPARPIAPVAPMDFPDDLTPTGASTVSGLVPDGIRLVLETGDPEGHEDRKEAGEEQWRERPALKC